MNLSMTGSLALAYTSGAQRARVVTEAWGEANLYCPNCSESNLTRLGHGTKVGDFSCPACKFWYQLKGQKTRIGNSIADGAYGSMMEAIQKDETPNFYFMHYDLATWQVRNLLLVPSFAFPPSAIIKRKPLSVTARRAGWVGCNIALHRIPPEARIALVTDSQAAPAAEVRAKFKRVKPLRELSVTKRGWTLDVLTIVTRLVSERQSRSANAPKEFKNEDVYAYAPELEKLHPDNRHIKDKIRQQLQVLRDMGLLLHPERDCWLLP